MMFTAFELFASCFVFLGVGFMCGRSGKRAKEKEMIKYEGEGFRREGSAVFVGEPRPLADDFE